jgi:hypothetical protein
MHAPVKGPCCHYLCVHEIHCHPWSTQDHVHACPPDCRLGTRSDPSSFYCAHATCGAQQHVRTRTQRKPTRQFPPGAATSPQVPSFLCVWSCTRATASLGPDCWNKLRAAAWLAGSPGFGSTVPNEQSRLSPSMVPLVVTTVPIGSCHSTGSLPTGRPENRPGHMRRSLVRFDRSISRAVPGRGQTSNQPVVGLRNVMHEHGLQEPVAFAAVVRWTRKFACLRPDQDPQVIGAVDTDVNK